MATVSMFSPVSPTVSPSLLRHLKWFRAFGSTPLEISEESLSNISVLSVVGIAVMLLTVALSSYIEHNVLLEGTVGSLGSSISAIRNAAGIAATLVIISMTVFNRFKYEKTMRKLITIQRVLGNTTYPMFASLKLLVVYWIGCLALRGVYKTRLTNKTTDWPLSIASTILWNVEMVNHICFCILFLYLVNCISSCFTKLSTTTFIENADVKRFIRIYTHLDDIAGDLNSYFDFTVFFIMSSCCTDLIYLTGVVYRGQELGKKDAIIIGYLTLFVVIAAAVSTIYTCQHLSDQADRCNSVLLRHLMDNTTFPHLDDILPSLLTHLSMQNGVTFKLLKSVPINYNLGISMVAAYITYTIVLFQFYSSSKSNET